MYLYTIKHMILEQHNFLFFFLYSNEREHLYPRNANRDVHMIYTEKTQPCMYLYAIKHMILEQHNFLFFFLYSNEREHLYPRNANRDVHMISST